MLILNNFFLKKNENVENSSLNYIFEMVSTQENIIFVLFLFSLFFSSFVLICTNPIFSLLFLIMAFLCVILVFFLLKIEFLALTFLIVYIGAIAILFLFVIMMFNLKRLQLTRPEIELFYFKCITGLFIPKFFIILKNELEQYFYNSNQNIIIAEKKTWISNTDLTFILKYKNNDILILTDFLYTDFSYLFILVSVVLLSSMIGSIVLAMFSQK